MTESVAIFWFRRDLRLEDNAALYHALKREERVQPVFIFDRDILDKLEDPADRRVAFIHDEIGRLKRELEAFGATLWVFHDRPIEVFKRLSEDGVMTALYANRDYEPRAIQRDKDVYELLHTKGIPFRAYKDQVIFEKNEVVKDDGSPYTVFTPYSKKWKSIVNDFYLRSYPVERYTAHFAKGAPAPVPGLESMGFREMPADWPSREVTSALLEHYADRRDFPGIQGTSRLSVHLRFGTLSIRTLSRFAMKHSEKFLNELIWREFYQYILWHFPHVCERSFKPAFDRIEWKNNPEWFQRWCDGTTGFPIVDAGMRELNATGYMHNRVRMIVASFLVKDLLIDWRLGEAYFAKKLLDFDLASNNGGWQWAAGCGVDAAPYFRVFNPHIQTEKFDPDRSYIRRWVPEYNRGDYPKPMVEHHVMKEQVLALYKEALPPNG